MRRKLSNPQARYRVGSVDMRDRKIERQPAAVKARNAQVAAIRREDGVEL
jgi:hypothetical protein